MWFNIIEQFFLEYEESQVYKNNPQFILELKNEIIRLVLKWNFQYVNMWLKISTKEWKSSKLS